MPQPAGAGAGAGGGPGRGGSSRKMHGNASFQTMTALLSPSFQRAGVEGDTPIQDKTTKLSRTSDCPSPPSYSVLSLRQEVSGDSRFTPNN